MNNSSHIENSTNLTPLIASNNNENTPTISITNITETTTLSNSNESLTSQNQSEISFMCRICHCEEKSHIDLLISPCYCNGSLNFVHQACLQKWLQLTGTETCELCHYNFKLIKKSKPLKKWEQFEISRSEKVKICLSIVLYLIAIIINTWSFTTFWNITIVHIKFNRFNWTFLTIILVLSSSFVCILSFVIFLIQIFYNLFKRWRAHNRCYLIKSLKKENV